MPCRRHLRLFALIRGLAVLLTLGLAENAAAAECPDHLRVVLLDFAIPPFLLGSGETFADPPGLIVEWLRRAMAETGCPSKLEFVRRPTKRAEAELISGESDMIGGAAPTVDRLKVMDFPMKNGQPDPSLAIGQAILSFYVHQGDDGVIWDGRNLLPPGRKVGVERGTLADRISRERGYDLEAVDSVEQNLTMLETGHVNVVLMSNIELDMFLGQKNRFHLAVLSPPLGQALYFLPVSQAFHARNRAFVDRFWHAACRQGRSYFTAMPPCPEG